MTISGWVEILAFCALLIVLSPFLGNYMAKVYTGQRVFLTPLFARPERFLLRLFRVDAEAAEQQPLGAPDDRREEDSLARVDLGHVAAEERRDGDQHRAEREDLQPAVEGHGLELLPAYQRVHQVDADQRRDDETEEIGGAHVRHEEAEGRQTRSIPSIIR